MGGAKRDQRDVARRHPGKRDSARSSAERTCESAELTPEVGTASTRMVNGPGGPGCSPSSSGRYRRLRGQDLTGLSTLWHRTGSLQAYDGGAHQRAPEKVD